MGVALLASMKIEVGFDQGHSMNGINFKIIWRCCVKNVFKDPDDNYEVPPLVLLTANGMLLSKVETSCDV